jgi:hypothetical protein
VRQEDVEEVERRRSLPQRADRADEALPLAHAADVERANVDLRELRLRVEGDLGARVGVHVLAAEVTPRLVDRREPVLEAGGEETRWR